MPTPLSSLKLPARALPAAPPSSEAVLLWRVAQAGSMVALAALVIGLVARPDVALDLLWNGAVPLLPAVFLLSPPIWRNICPLATLNMAASGWGDRNTRRKRRPSDLRTWGGAGIAVLVFLVPARHFLFNTNGPALAGAIIAVALLSLVLGLRFANKSGFCNAICPVLPVERLYGQSPMLRVANPRCLPCVTCSGRGCMDRSPESALEEAMDYPRTGAHWLRSPFGSFAVAFPGFVFGYFQATDVPMAQAGTVYGTVAIWAGASWLVGAGLTVLGVPRRLLLRGAAALAVGAYYWFAAASVREAWGLGSGAELGMRLVTGALIVTWFAQASARDRRVGVGG